MMDKVLVIVGPTAVGKTALSIELAKKIGGEIISGDSMQVYRSLDIGTAKVTAEEMAGVPHFLINERDIDESYSAADFQQSARESIAGITAKKKLPIVVGGTGLYIQSLLYDFLLGSDAEEDTGALRQKYEALADASGNEDLWQLLQEKDPVAAEKIHFNNRKKVIRALEVYDQTGFSIFEPKEKPEPLYDFLMIGLNTERALLYQRINQRVDIMLEQGLLEEARLLYPHPEYQASQGIGYKEFFPYFAGEMTLEEAVEKVKMNSRRYAKRQLTWFSNRAQAVWFDLLEKPEAIGEISDLINQWLTHQDL